MTQRKMAIFTGIACIMLFSCAPEKEVRHNGDYNILNYGACADSLKMNTAVFQKVIDKCSENGGGRVLVPPGKYLTGSIFMKSNVELHLMMGATIFGSTDSVDYPHRLVDMKSFSRDGKSRHSFFGLIMADGVENISITGQGTIDGNGQHSEDFACYPLGDELDSPWHKPRRPRLLYFYNSRNVKIHDIKAINPNDWTMHFKRCDFLEINGVTIHAHANANGDGIDLDECRDVVISNCILDTDDNAIILKSLGTRDTENITITNCIFASKITAIKTGTESGGGFKNITISNCIIRSSYEEEHYDAMRQQMNGSGIALEITDGGTMDGVTITNIVMEDCYAPFFIRLGNRGRQYGGVEPEPGKMRNIILDNIICKNVRNNYTSTIAGFPGHYIENLTMSNIRMECEGGIGLDNINPMPENEKGHPWPGMYGRHQQYPAYGIFFRHVKNLRIFNMQIEYAEKDLRPALYLDRVHNAKILYSDFQAVDEPVYVINSSDISIVK